MADGEEAVGGCCLMAAADVDWYASIIVGMRRSWFDGIAREMV